MTLNGVMAVELRYFTEFGCRKWSVAEFMQESIVFLVRVHVILKKVHVRYLISWWVSCTTNPSDVDVIEYINNNAVVIQEQLNRAVQEHTCVKYYATMDVQFYHTTADGELYISQRSVRCDRYQHRRRIQEFTSAEKNFNKRGSNWIVDLVVDFQII